MTTKTISELPALATITDSDMFIVRDPEELTGAKTKYALASTVGTYIAGELGLGDDNAAIESLTGTGILARTADNTWALRTITGTAAEITVTNGDGVSGAPTISLPSALTFTSKTITGGTFSGPTIAGPTFSGSIAFSGVVEFADGTASAPSITNTGDTNTGIFFPVGTNEIAFSTAGTQRFTVTASAILAGHTASVAIAGTSAANQWFGGTMALSRWINDSGAARFMIAKSRSGTVGTIGGIVQSGDTIGEVKFAADDGADITSEAASIYCQVDGTPGSNDMPGRLVFATTADGDASVTERLILDSTGVLKPAANDGVALGTTALGFADLHFATGATINVANGNWLATHTSGILTVGTGDLRVTTAGTNAASVVTVGGTQTLTAKTLTSPTITTSPTAAGATWTDLGTVTTADINGGTLDGVIIGGASAAAATVTTLTVNTNANPDANDGAGLGTGSLGWSDLFMASGAVIDFANANSVITHSSGILTVSTGDLRVTTAGTNTASVVTVGGTQTLTAKTLTSPVIGTSPTAAGATWTDLGTVTEGTFANGGLHILDTNATHDLIITPGSNLTADRVLTITTGDAARTLDISAASVTISSFAATVLDDTTAQAACATLGTWKLIAASAVAASHTGNTDETTLATITVPAGAMGANGVVRVVAQWDVTNSANTKTVRQRLASISGTIFRTQALTTAAGYRDHLQFANRNATNSQVGHASGTSGGSGTSATACVTDTQDTTASLAIVLTAQLANSGETIALQSYLAEVFYQA